MRTSCVFGTPEKYRSARRNGYIASRFGGDGICMSCATGEFMADLIETGEPPLRARRMFEYIAPRVASG